MPSMTTHRTPHGFGWIHTADEPDLGRLELANLLHRSHATMRSQLFYSRTPHLGNALLQMPVELVQELPTALCLVPIVEQWGPFGQAVRQTFGPENVYQATGLIFPAKELLDDGLLGGTSLLLVADDQQTLVARRARHARHYQPCPPPERLADTIGLLGRAHHSMLDAVQPGDSR